MPKRIIPDWVHHEMLNWARWCWRGSYPHPTPAGHCGSPEWQYQRINEDGDAESIDRKPIPVNEYNAKIVQGVYDGLPDIQKQVLRAEYPQRGLKLKLGQNESESAFSSAIYRVILAFEE